MELSTVRRAMILTFVLVLTMSMQPIQAQRDEYRIKLNAVLKKADVAYQDYKFSIAADYYDSYLLEATDDTEEPLRKLADCYWQMRAYGDALRTYNLLYQNKDDIVSKSQEERYRIAELNARFGNYQKASKWLEGVAGYEAKATTYKSYEKLDLMKEDSLNWQINLPNINTTYREFSPFLLGDMLFFCSNKLLPSSEKTFAWDGCNFTHLWKVPISEIRNVSELTLKDSTALPGLKRNSQKLAGAYELGDKPLTQNALRLSIREYYAASNRNSIGSLVKGLNNSSFNIGSIDMDKFNHVYFSTNYSKFTRGVNRIGLMEGIYSPTHGISKTHALALGDPKTYSAMHPAVNGEGTIIVFSSDKPDGKGGFDLYYAKRENNNSRWGEIQTFRGNLNTVGNEVFPSITQKGDLYFSSNALPGLGGLDIYRINLEDALSGKGEPEHLSYPVNSSADDFGLTFEDTGLKGYFTSDRLNNDDNIYSFRFEAQEKIPKVVIRGIVKDEISNEPIKNTTLFLLNKNDNRVVVSKSDAKGKYSFLVSSTGDFVLKGVDNGHSDNCLTIKINHGESHPNDSIVNPDLLLGRMKIGVKWSLGTIVYNKVNFDIRTVDKPVLDNLLRMLNRYPVKIEIGVHTDSRGSSANNERESQHGGNSALFYLLDHGINPDRVVSKGYGESQLINKCADGVPCTEKEHQANNRTEVKIIGFTIPIRDFKIDTEKFNAGDRLEKASFPSGYFESCK